MWTECAAGSSQWLPFRTVEDLSTLMTSEQVRDFHTHLLFLYTPLSGELGGCWGRWYRLRCLHGKVDTTYM